MNGGGPPVPSPTVAVLTVGKVPTVGEVPGRPAPSVASKLQSRVPSPAQHALTRPRYRHHPVCARACAVEAV
jgi:hypothetical protein